jgi:cytochrome P450
MQPFEYDPTTADFQEDPLPMFRALRDEHPAYHNERLRFWALTRWDDVWNAVSDWQTFASDPANYPDLGYEPTELMPRWMMDFGIFYMDPPRHNRLRALLSRTFTPMRIGAMEPVIRAIARSYLEQLAPDGHFELMHDYAAPLTTTVVGALLGVPEADRWQFRLWGERIEQRDPDIPVHIAQAEQVEAVEAIRAYLRALIAERRTHPQDDVLSALLEAEVDGDRLEEEEVVGLCYQLMIAGNETTALLIANGAIRLAELPDQRRLLLDDPGLIANAVEEMARYDSPTVQSPPRITTREVELHGQRIAKGQPVVFVWMAANHDERQFPDPDRFDVARGMERHLGFGFGLHYCVGASLARLESRVAFEELLAAIPDYQLNGTPQRWTSTWLRVIGIVPVAFDADRAMGALQA